MALVAGIPTRLLYDELKSELSELVDRDNVRYYCLFSGTTEDNLGPTVDASKV